MKRHTYTEIEKLLASSNAEDVQRGLEMVQAQSADADAQCCSDLYDLLASLLYIDPLDRPDLVPVLEGAISAVAELGEPIIPTLIKSLESGDVKAEMAAAQALGQMGGLAIGPLLDEYRRATDGAARTFILYALSKIRQPEIVQAVPLAIEAAGAVDQELRDTATRSLGKFVEVVPPSLLMPQLRDRMYDALMANVADANPVVRAKAVRSLGKLAKFGHLSDDQREELLISVRSLLGEDEQFEWDRAYIVRREAKEAQSYL